MSKKTCKLHITDIELPEQELRKLETHDERITRERRDANIARNWSVNGGVKPSKIGGR